MPFGDWIVGYAGGVLRGEGDFYDVVENVSVRVASQESEARCDRADLTARRQATKVVCVQRRL